MRYQYPLRLIVLAVFSCSLFLTFSPHISAAEDLPLSFEWELASLPEKNKAQAQGLAVLQLVPQKGWYCYSQDPGPVGMPTRIRAKLMPGGNSLNTYYPPSKEKKDPSDPQLTASVFEGKTPFFIPLPQSAAGKQLALKAEVNLLMCSSGRCRPVNTSTEFKLDNYNPKDLAQASAQDWWSKWQAAVTLKAEPPSPDAGPLQEAEPAPAGQTKSVAPEKLNLNPQYFSPGMEVEGLAKAILFAVLAGLILNFMPCVLPVISLKLRSLFPGPEQKDMQEHKKRFRLHNLFFALGILIYFLVLATIIAITEMAWGQIFQNPIAVLILATIVFILSLSLLDVFNLPVIDLKGSSHQSSNYKLEALSTGVLATLLATPCSGPFLGGVLAWGLLQPPLVIATVLTFVGVGMALPYLIMVVYPSFVHIFTRPGNWMIHLERIVAFLLIATCIYLLSLLPPEYYLKALILLWTAGLGAWIWGQWTNLSQSAARRWGIRSISILLILAAGFYAASPPAPPEKVWQEFEMQTFRQQLGQKPLLVEFTANWCPNCKLLEKTVLKEEAVKKLKEQYSLQAIKVDLSYRSPKGMGLLKELGSQSIPLLAIFPAGKESSNPVVIRDLFSEEDLHMALEKALQ